MEKKPGRGDLVWLEFDKIQGHEQRGRRPAVIISPRQYNERTGLALVCPVTSKKKGYPFEISIHGKIKGVILADQIRSVDWNARKCEIVGKVSPTTMQRISKLVSLLLP